MVDSSKIHSIIQLNTKVSKRMATQNLNVFLLPIVMVTWTTFRIRHIHPRTHIRVQPIRTHATIGVPSENDIRNRIVILLGSLYAALPFCINNKCSHNGTVPERPLRNQQIG